MVSKWLFTFSLLTNFLDILVGGFNFFWIFTPVQKEIIILNLMSIFCKRAVNYQLVVRPHVFWLWFQSSFDVCHHLVRICFNWFATATYSHYSFSLVLEEIAQYGCFQWGWLRWLFGFPPTSAHYCLPQPTSHLPWSARADISCKVSLQLYEGLSCFLCQDSWLFRFIGSPCFSSPILFTPRSKMFLVHTSCHLFF